MYVGNDSKKEAVDSGTGAEMTSKKRIRGDNTMKNNLEIEKKTLEDKQ